MNRPQKSLVRWALVIHRGLFLLEPARRLIDLPIGAWQRASELARRIRRAELHGWQLAAARLREDLAAPSRHCRRRWWNSSGRSPAPCGVPTGRGPSTSTKT